MHFLNPARMLLAFHLFPEGVSNTGAAKYVSLTPTYKFQRHSEVNLVRPFLRCNPLTTLSNPQTL